MNPLVQAIDTSIVLHGIRKEPLTLSIGALSVFRDLWNDRGNWSGHPMVDLVSLQEKGWLTALKRAKLLTTRTDDGSGIEIAYTTFTADGEVLGAQIDLGVHEIPATKDLVKQIKEALNSKPAGGAKKALGYTTPQPEPEVLVVDEVTPVHTGKHGSKFRELSPGEIEAAQIGLGLKKAVPAAAILKLSTGGSKPRTLGKTARQMALESRKEDAKLKPTAKKSANEIAEERLAKLDMGEAGRKPAKKTAAKKVAATKPIAPKEIIVEGKVLAPSQDRNADRHAAVKEVVAKVKADSWSTKRDYEPTIKHLFRTYGGLFKKTWNEQKRRAYMEGIVKFALASTRKA